MKLSAKLLGLVLTLPIRSDSKEGWSENKRNVCSRKSISLYHDTLIYSNALSFCLFFYFFSVSSLTLFPCFSFVSVWLTMEFVFGERRDFFLGILFQFAFSREFWKILNILA